LPLLVAAVADQDSLLVVVEEQAQLALSRLENAAGRDFVASTASVIAATIEKAVRSMGHMVIIVVVGHVVGSEEHEASNLVMMDD